MRRFVPENKCAALSVCPAEAQPETEVIMSNPNPPNSATLNELSHAFKASLHETLSEGMRKINHCASQLNEEQFWHRPRPEMNGIANLCLHLSGNLRQWIIAGVGGAKGCAQSPLGIFRSLQPRKERDPGAAESDGEGSRRNPLPPESRRTRARPGGFRASTPRFCTRS